MTEAGWLFGAPPKIGFDLGDVRARAAHVPLMVAFGAGTDSTAMLIGLHREGLRPDLITFADTGGEKPGTYEHLERVQAWCRRVGFPEIVTVRLHKPVAGDKTLEAECLRLEAMPSRVVGGGVCALRWKLEPQEKYVAKWAPFIACRAAGDKPFRAKGYEYGEENRATVHEDDYGRNVHPLIEWQWDRDTCIDVLRSEGLPVPVKSACFYCPSSQKHEVIWLSQAHPDLFARAVEMERAALDGGKFHSVKGLGRHWSWARLVSATPEERDLFMEAPVESCTECSDGGCTPTIAA